MRSSSESECMEESLSSSIGKSTLARDPVRLSVTRFLSGADLIPMRYWKNASSSSRSGKRLTPERLKVERVSAGPSNRETGK